MRDILKQESQRPQKKARKFKSIKYIWILGQQPRAFSIERDFTSNSCISDLLAKSCRLCNLLLANKIKSRSTEKHEVIGPKAI